VTTPCARTAAFGGVVVKYMGDGVLVYFGFPRAHEDNTVKALRAGLVLTEEVPRVSVPSGVDLRRLGADPQVTPVRRRERGTPNKG
jgi:class 3 adenylate cyclase